MVVSNPCITKNDQLNIIGENLKWQLNLLVRIRFSSIQNVDESDQISKIPFITAKFGAITRSSSHLMNLQYLNSKRLN